MEHVYKRNQLICTNNLVFHPRFTTTHRRIYTEHIALDTNWLPDRVVLVLLIKC